MWKGLLRIAHTNVRLLNYNNKFCIRLLFFTPNTSSYTFITLLALPISKLYKPKVQFASRRFVLQEYGKRQLYFSKSFNDDYLYQALKLFKNNFFDNINRSMINMFRIRGAWNIDHNFSDIELQLIHLFNQCRNSIIRLSINMY